MSPINNLLNTQPAITNIIMTNADLSKLETINKTMSANIEILNKRVDFLILKLINLIIFLFQNKNKNKYSNELLREQFKIFIKNI
jgi:hypothetical protein